MGVPSAHSQLYSAGMPSYIILPTLRHPLPMQPPRVDANWKFEEWNLFKRENFQKREQFIDQTTGIPNQKQNYST